MGRIGFGYGSEWHLLRYLGYHRNYLNNEILKAAGGQAVEWLDFGFTHKNKRFERDKELRGISFIESPTAQQLWKSYWPQTGSPPNWDAVGKIKRNQEEVWLLVEAKAHSGELNSNCGAGKRSREIIKNAFSQTRACYNITHGTIEDWFEPYYQYCNRLAVLNFLMNICQPAIPAYLVFIYFYGDLAPNAQCPQSRKEWQPILEEMYSHIGLNADSKAREHIHNIFLPVNPAAKE